MLGVLLKILSLAGICLLAVTGVLLLLVLLVLFFPVTYRADCDKKGSQFRAAAKVSWLFGFVRLRFSYPAPGSLRVKLLMFTLYDSSKKKEPKQASAEKKRKEKKQAPKTEEASNKTEAGQEQPEEAQKEQPSQQTKAAPENAGKIAKIKYTIRRFCDKIKKIRDNITYYTELLRDDSTKEAFSAVCLRIAKMLRHMLPHRRRADILYGTGSPDTTGYLYGVYGMFCAALGPKVKVTPDFEQTV
jgi:hypothetical protein